jgi:cytochrome c-type biogenesis protein CcmH/NrfG
MDADHKPDQKATPYWLRISLLVLSTAAATVLYFCWPIFLQQYRESQARSHALDKIQELQRALDAKRASDKASCDSAPKPRD